MKRINVFLLSALCLITFFVNGGALPTDIMEARNIVTGREMVSDGHWLVPTMNGALRLEKPPLPTWVAGAIEEVCPASLTAQRMAPAVMGCFWTFYLFLFARYFSRRTDVATAAVMVFLTCYNLVLMGRSATWDIYCHAFMMAAIYYLTRALYEDHHHRQWFTLAGLFMGLSFLSKGPVSFYALLLPYLITMAVLPQPMMQGKWKSFFAMIVIMLITGGWWYAYLLAAHPAEVSEVIGKESGAWSNHNVRPWWYYWRFFLEMGAWSVLMLAALCVSYWKRHIVVKREYLLSVTWAVASIVLLSLMPEKKTRYLLPTLAPCSIVVACLLVHFKQGKELDKPSKWLYIGNGILLTLIALAMPALIYHFGVKEGMISSRAAVFASICMLTLAVWLLRCTLRYRPMAFAGGISALFVLAELFLLPTIGHSLGNPDAHSIAATQTDRRVKGLSFYHEQQEPLRIELVYEAQRKILPLDFSNEQTVKAALPCVLVSRKWAREEIPARVLATLDTVTIGTFDDNKHPRANKHYTGSLVSHVTLLKKKEQTIQYE